MFSRRKQVSGPRAVIEGVVGAAEAARRSDIADQAAEAANRVATTVANKSADLSSQAGERMGDVAHAVSEEGRALMKERAKNRGAKRPRRHRLRNGALMAGIGAAAAYFLDPKNGAERRAAAKRRTSTSAQAVGEGLDKAAHVAHQTAEATSPDPTADQRVTAETLGVRPT